MMLRKRETLIAYLFIAPALFAFLALVFFPVLASGALSFTKWNFLSGLGGIEFIGLDNFRLLTEDQIFAFAVRNTLLYAVTTVPITVVVSLGLANALNRQRFLKKTLRVVYFIPFISNQVALAAIFKYLFREQDGPINLILGSVFGFETLPAWLLDPRFNRIPIISLVIWTGIGFQLIVYLAALQNIPESLYEAAEIDGASGLQRFVRITVPLVSPATFYLITIRTIEVLKIFAAVKILSYGGGGTATVRSNTSMVMRIYAESFGSYKFGYASAQAWVLFVLILLVTIILFWSQKRWVHYS